MKVMFNLPEPSASNARDGWFFEVKYLARVKEKANDTFGEFVSMETVESVIRSMLMVRGEDEE